MTCATRYYFRRLADVGFWLYGDKFAAKQIVYKPYSLDPALPMDGTSKLENYREKFGAVCLLFFITLLTHFCACSET